VRIFKEPIFHFIILGALLFVIDAVRSDEDVPADSSPGVLVTDEIVESIAATLEAEIGRPPTSTEVEAQVARWIRDEALRLEAVRLGLDQNDPIIQRRLVQNMRFLLEATEPPAEPTEAEVDAWLEEHLPDPAARARVDFIQVFVDVARHDDPARRATELATMLERGDDPTTLGDPFIRGRSFRNVGRAEIERLLGEAAAGQILALEEGVWSGRIESPYGFHFVRVERRTVPPAGGSEADRQAAKRALALAATRAAEEAAIDRIVARTPVIRADGADGPQEAE
jgi:hypothetical protein